MHKTLLVPILNYLKHVCTALGTVLLQRMILRFEYVSRVDLNNTYTYKNWNRGVDYVT
jgi:hypothetical protein